VPDNPGYFVLMNQLDEAEDGEYYCLDVFGSTMEEGDGMQVHTCKDRPRPAEDFMGEVAVERRQRLLRTGPASERRGALRDQR
jgi:hypothetical protein